MASLTMDTVELRIDESIKGYAQLVMTHACWQPNDSDPDLMDVDITAEVVYVMEKPRTLQDRVISS